MALYDIPPSYRMRAPLLVLASVLMIALPIEAQVPCVGQASVLSADTATFLVQAPPGWTLDCEAGKDQGPLTVLYRVGESWRTGAAVMYVSVLTEQAPRSRSFTKRVDTEVADWKRRTPDARVTVLPSLATKMGGTKKAAVRRFQSPATELFEVVAYVPRGRIMPLLTMTARSEMAFNDALPAFRRLVQSYSPATLKIVP